MWKKIKSYLTTPIPGDITAVFSGDLIGDFYGFVYNITNVQNGRQYIGRKYFWQKRKLDLVLKMENGVELHLKATGATTMDLVQKLKQDVEKYGRDSFRRTILSLHETPGKVNYEETRQLLHKQCSDRGN